MLLLLLIQLMLVMVLLVFSSISMIRFMLLIIQTIEPKYGLTIVLTQHGQFPVVWPHRILCLLRVMVIFMLTMEV